MNWKTDVRKKEIQIDILLEFRDEAVRFVINSGNSGAHRVNLTGVSKSTISTWVTACNKSQSRNDNSFSFAPRQN